MSIVERVREVVEPLLEKQSLTVYDIEHSGSALRILVDAPGGVDLLDQDRAEAVALIEYGRERLAQLSLVARAEDRI